MNRIVRRGFSPVACTACATAITLAAPVPLSCAPVPGFHESRCPPTITYSPPGGVSGQVLYLDDASVEGVKAAAPKIKDSIVLVDGESIRKHPDEPFGKLFDALDLLAGEGARMLRSVWATL